MVSIFKIETIFLVYYLPEIIIFNHYIVFGDFRYFKWRLSNKIIFLINKFTEMIKPKVLCFGELLYRIQGNNELFLYDETVVQLFSGGAEANVAVLLGQLGIDVQYFSVGPDNILVNNILDKLREYKVDVSKFKLAGDRLGSYILLGANGLSSGDVIYDRKYSSFSQLNVDSINWDDVFSGVDWFHWTALTPALSECHADLCHLALQEAKKRNLVISVDLNYRSKLWQYGKDPIDIMPKLISYCDVIMGNIWASNKFLGTYLDDSWSDDRSQVDYPSAANSVAKEIFNTYKQCNHLAFTFRFMDNPKHNLFYATYHSPENNYVSEIKETSELIDRIGSGDAFMGGFIAGIIQGYSPQDLISFATDMGYKKLFVKGDFLKI